MGTTSDQILKLAISQLGIKETPANSNNVIYNTEYYGREVNGSVYPWCCAFIWWLFKHTNSLNLFNGGNKTASCTTLMNYYKRIGKWSLIKGNPGDLVFFNFDKVADADHIGILEYIDSNGIAHTIEGNTGVENDANGGMVMRRERKSNLILGYAHIDYTLENNNGWIQENGKWKYYRNNVLSCGQWLEINNQWYMFDGNGYMVTGWFKDSNNNWFYLNDNINAYLPEGAMITGWMCDNKQRWFYFAKNTDEKYIKGQMVTGWLEDTDKRCYFLNDGTINKFAIGEMVKGTILKDGIIEYELYDELNYKEGQLMTASTRDPGTGKKIIVSHGDAVFCAKSSIQSAVQYILQHK